MLHQLENRNMNEQQTLVQIIEVMIRAEAEDPASFKQRIADLQLGVDVTKLPEGVIGRATLTAHGLDPDMRWGQAHEELPDDMCVLAWWSLSLAKDEFIAVDKAAMERAIRRAQIANTYAEAMRKAFGNGHKGVPGSMHTSFAEAVLSKNAYALKHLANGLNGVAKATFTEVTGVPLPKLQGETWRAIRRWAGVTDAQDAVFEAKRKVAVELDSLKAVVRNPSETHAWIKRSIAEGFTRLVNQRGRWFLANEAGTAYDLSQKGTGFAQARPLIKAELDLADAEASLAAETSAGVVKAEVEVESL